MALLFLFVWGIWKEVERLSASICGCPGKRDTARVGAQRTEGLAVQRVLAAEARVSLGASRDTGAGAAKAGTVGVE